QMDKQITHEKTEYSTHTSLITQERTLLAGKPQGAFQKLLDYVYSSIFSLFGFTDDFVFNDALTEEKLDKASEGTLNYLAPLDNGLLYPNLRGILEATYRKFDKVTRKEATYRSVQEKIEISEYTNGTISEIRTYSNNFDEPTHNINCNYRIYDTSQGVSIEIPDNYVGALVTNRSIYEDVWAEKGYSDNVPLDFDSLKIIDANGNIETTSWLEKEITLIIPHRFSAYNDYGKVNQETAIGEDRFTVSGIFITPPDGVYYTSDKKLFKKSEAKTDGHYFFIDEDGDGELYETVYVLIPDYDNDNAYYVQSVGYNYNGKNDVVPYQRVEISTDVLRDEFENLISQESAHQFAGNWVFNFATLKSNQLLFPKDNYDGYESKDRQLRWVRK
ncbi:MAG: hypothetical protein P8Y23_17690, partial [Candidatus Lokiarchaeota archaeon]